MYSEPAAWKRLMTKLVTVQADYLVQQAKSGASALQLFDSWAGLALSKDDYDCYVKPFNTALFARLRSTGVPVINFSTGTSSYLQDVASCGGDVVGVDWRMPLDWSWEKIGLARPIQGNLDPVALLAPWRELKFRIDDVLEKASAAKDIGGSAHIFNLGHGIFPNTPVENVKRLVDYVHEQTAATD
jgi:uroporphyrinogen decarboxylase